MRRIATPSGDCAAVSRRRRQRSAQSVARLAADADRAQPGARCADRTTTRRRWVINGHLHYRVIVNFERLTVLNAGTLKGEHRPGVSILDFDGGTATAFEFGARGVVASRRGAVVAGRRRPSHLARHAGIRRRLDAGDVVRDVAAGSGPPPRHGKRAIWPRTQIYCVPIYR